ncbi:MAG: SMP-30/gluconolactonase/LRE family protein [Myxococcota bacterium]
MRAVAMGALATLWACQPPEVAKDTDPASSSSSPTDPTTPGTDTTPPDTSSSPTTPTDTAAPWSEDVDCSLLLDPPLTATRYNWVPGSEDFTFSADGELLNVSGGGLKATPFGGPSQLLVPLSAEPRGARLLPDGRLALAVAADGAILLVDPATGGQQIAASGVNNPNGIAVAPDGRIYTATSNGQVVRVDPASGAVDVVVDLPGNSFDGIVFSPDYRRLYFDEEFGQIHYVDVDAQGDLGEPHLGGRIPLGGGGFSILDGMAVDACGNLYVAEMNGTVWRVRTDGTVEDLVDVGGVAIIPALNFGIAPVGGWRETALYVITFTGSIYEIEVGVPGKWEPHLPAR